MNKQKPFSLAQVGMVATAIAVSAGFTWSKWRNAHPPEVHPTKYELESQDGERLVQQARLAEMMARQSRISKEPTDMTEYQTLRDVVLFAAPDEGK